MPPLSLCMICMSACTAYLFVCLSVCLSFFPFVFLSFSFFLLPHISTKDQALKDVLVLSLYPNCLISFTAYLFLPRRRLGAFRVVLLPVGYGVIKPGRHKLNILHKKGKKKDLALVTQTIGFIVFM